MARLQITLVPSIGSPCTEMQPLLLGKIPSGRGTADVFVTIATNDGPLMRVDLYRDADSPWFRQDAIALGGTRVRRVLGSGFHH